MLTLPADKQNMDERKCSAVFMLAVERMGRVVATDLHECVILMFLWLCFRADLQKVSRFPTVWLWSG